MKTDVVVDDVVRRHAARCVLEAVVGLGHVLIDAADDRARLRQETAPIFGMRLLDGFPILVDVCLEDRIDVGADCFAVPFAIGLGDANRRKKKHQQDHRFCAHEVNLNTARHARMSKNCKGMGFVHRLRDDRRRRGAIR